jgi:hypothetical protein
MRSLSCQSIVWTTVWLILGVAPAEAAPELFVNLRYDVDPTLSGCMGEPDFRAMVARQVGYDPYHSNAALGVEVRVRPAEHGIRGAIDWSASAHRRLGERHFTSERQDCNTMLATMGFVLAVQLQLMVKEAVAEPSPGSMDTDHTSAPDARGHQPSADTDHTSAPDARRRQPTADSNRVVEVTAPPPAVASEEPPTSRSPITPWSGIAGIGPSAGFGLGPDPIAQGRLFLSVQAGQAAFELGGEASLPSTTRQDYGGGFRHRLVLGTAAACGLRGSSSACAVVKLGQIGAQGVAVDKPASPRGFLAQVGARIAYSLQLGDRLALVGHADALYLLTSWTVDVNQVAVWTMPRLGAVAGIDLAVRFW